MKKSRFPIFSTVLAVLLFGSLVFGGYYFIQYQNLKSESSKTAEEKNEELISKVSKVYELPEDQDPAVYFVTDEAKFKEEYPNLTAAKQGDALLVYIKKDESVGQAILFRESENKVIATLPVSVGKSVHLIATSEKQSTSEQVLNGLNGLVRVTSKATPSGTVSSTVVVDLTGNNQELVKQVSQAIGGTVAATLPAGENVPDGTEVAVIVAQ